MANEIGTTLLNSLTNSTFDIGNMAKVLAGADVAGARATLTTKEEKTNVELSALSYVESNMKAFQSYLVDLSSPTIFQARDIASSDESVVSVQATGNAVTGSYAIESKQLAQSHTLVANKSYSSASDLISTGTLDITVGGQTNSIVIDSSNNTLEGLQSIVNNGDYGVNASIINNGGQYQIMFSSKVTGAASEISLSGLSDFDVDGLTTTSEAQDAVMSINGLDVSNSTNDFGEVIQGLNIQLKTVSGVSQSISVAPDTQKVVDTVVSFVDVYNQLDTILDDLGSYRTLTADEQESPDFDFFGDLAGSSLLRDLKEQVRSSLNGAISELTDPNTLAAVGVSFDREGQLTVDTALLNTVAQSNLSALELVFSKGGTSSDSMINVTGSSQKTQAGDYAIDVTQMAERATVAGSAVTYAANEYRAGGDRVLDPQSTLNIASGASFQLSIAGAADVAVNFTAGAYLTKNDVAAQMQTDINTALSAAGSASVTVAFDTAQSRFEITTADGTMSISSTTALSNQGLGSTAGYTGDQLIDLSGAAGTFDVAVDGSTAASATVSAGKYTLDELAVAMQSSINNLSEVSSSGAQVAVSTDGGVLGITSTRFGFASNVTMSNFTDLGNAGLTADLADDGQNIDGTITTAEGTLSLGGYADSEDGRKVKISDFAVIAGEAASVRGLEFEVLGGATGSRGSITFSQGFASRLEDTISRLFEGEYGLVTQRIDSLSSQTSEYETKRETLDVRYEKMLLKYQMQFSTLQSLLSSSQQTSDFLTATFSNNNN